MRSLFYAHPISDGFVEGSKGYEVGRAMFGAYQGRDLLDPKPSANATPAADVKRLGEVQVPTLVINGERELPYFMIVAEVLAYGIPGAERQVVPGGGHSVQLQQPARFNAAIERFLARVYGPVR
jgi:pimeloyl-ACP methyl ester carboxylesterase